MKTATAMGLIAVLLLPAFVNAGCPPLDLGALYLPKDKDFAKKRFLKKAQKLNDSGQCVVEGSFGRSYDKFYFTVSPTGQPSKEAKILRFTYEEMKK